MGVRPPRAKRQESAKAEPPTIQDVHAAVISGAIRQAALLAIYPHMTRSAMCQWVKRDPDQIRHTHAIGLIQAFIQLTQGKEEKNQTNKKQPKPSQNAATIKGRRRVKSGIITTAA